MVLVVRTVLLALTLFSVSAPSLLLSDCAYAEDESSKKSAEGSSTSSSGEEEEEGEAED